MGSTNPASIRSKNAAPRIIQTGSYAPTLTFETDTFFFGVL